MSETFNTIWSYPLITFSNGYVIVVEQVVLIIGLLVIGYGISRLIEFLVGRRLSRTRLRPDAVFTLKRVMFYTLLLLVVMTALNLLRIPLTAFAFVTGAIAIGVGFGAQNIINNFISGWILMTERPIRINDLIELEGSYGVVERIGTRSTRIRRIDGVHMLVPNSFLLEQTVTNWTLIDHKTRTSVRVGVAYGSPVERVAEIFMEAVCAQDSIDPEPKPIVVFEDFGDSTLVFDSFFWCEVYGTLELRQIRSNVRFELMRRFADEGIEIAFPQRDVHIDSKQPFNVSIVEPTARQ